jgi:MFS family permease
MTLPVGLHQQYLHYLLNRDVTKLYMAILIRNLGLGMISMFEAIYILLYFEKSIPFTLLYFAAVFGLYGIMAPLGGMFMAKFGAKKSILFSYVFYISYYVFLFFLDVSPLFMLLAIIAGALSMMFFWPAFHTDFVRFSSKQQRGKESGRVNVAMLLPAILAPAVGGIIIAYFGFPVLFLVVGVVLFASAIPLFYSKEHIEMYTDSYTGAFKRVFKRENFKTSVGLLSQGVELGVHLYIWPLFLFSIAISFAQIGGIAAFALVASSMFMLYAGRLSDTQERSWVLNLGGLWTAIAWILKYFVTTPFSAMLAQAIYQVSRAAARVPFWAYFYEKAAAKEEEADEFIIYHEMLVNMGMGVVFSILAGVFLLFPSLPLQAIFLMAALLALGISFVGNPPRITFMHP